MSRNTDERKFRERGVFSVTHHPALVTKPVWEVQTTHPDPSNIRSPVLSLFPINPNLNSRPPIYSLIQHAPP